LEGSAKEYEERRGYQAQAAMLVMRFGHFIYQAQLTKAEGLCAE
jgi:hypothetical protein